MQLPSPRLEILTVDGVRVWRDEQLAQEHGVLVAFSERAGGVSRPPFSSLNVAAHVGDDPSAVDENRRRLLVTVGLGRFMENLIVPEQTHGDSIAIVTKGERGSGALCGRGRPPIAATDALVTAVEGYPLMLCFADCVPVILVAPGPVVAVVHAGWRGALASLPGAAVRSLAGVANCKPGSVLAYIGPHIRACHYPVDETTVSHFVNAFGTLARVDSGGLNLEFAVTASLTDAGVATCNIACLGPCTAEATDRFFSYRAEQSTTGRHAALACVLPRD